jgi:hypothetical protein
MLDVVQPARIDPRRSSAKFDRTSVEVELAHADRKEWTIWATVGDRDAMSVGKPYNETGGFQRSKAESARPKKEPKALD